MREKFLNVLDFVFIFFLAFSLAYFVSSLSLFKIPPCFEKFSFTQGESFFSRSKFSPLEKEGFFKSKEKFGKEQKVVTSTFSLGDYALKGTIICSECKHSIALIKNLKSNEVKPVTVGDEIGGYKVVEIRPKLVILKRGDEIVYLRLFSLKNLKPKVSSFSVEDKRTFTVKRKEILDEISSGRFLRYINILPVDSPVPGLKVLYVNYRSFIYKLGIRPGDIITGINDVEIRTPEDSFSAFEQLKSSDAVTVTLYRNGKKIKLHYELE